MINIGKCVQSSEPDEPGIMLGIHNNSIVFVPK